MPLDWKDTREVVGWISAVAVVGSITLGFFGIWERFDPGKPLKKAQAIVLGVWILVPPIWFWAEYFFLYKDEATSTVKLEAFKYGQDQSAKIWLALITTLAGLYFGKDLVREAPTPSSTQQSSADQRSHQGSQSAPSPDAHASKPPDKGSR